MKILRLTALLGVATVAGASSTTFAQTDAPVVPTKTEAATPRTRLIPIKNVPPSLIAYQIDPAHNPRPAELGAADEKAEVKGAFDLPGDIQHIVAVDPQKSLLVAGGSDEDFRQMQELVDILDQPQRQLELEVQVVEMGTEDAHTLGFEISKTSDDTKKLRKPSTFDLQVASAKGNVMARLNALVANSRAKVITAPSATAFNNFSVELPIQKDRILPMTTAIGGPDQTLSRVLADVLLKATPTINGDDTISLDIELVRKLAVFDKTQSYVETKMIVHALDGGTIVMGDLAPLLSAGARVPIIGDIPLISALFRSKTSDYGRVTLIFVTPHIVRRAVNETPKP